MTHCEAESQLTVNWLTLFNCFFQSILHLTIVGEEWMKRRRVEAGDSKNREQECQQYLQLTQLWPFWMFNDSPSPHHVSLSDWITHTLIVCSCTYTSPAFSCGLLWPGMTTCSKESSSPSSPSSAVQWPGTLQATCVPWSMNRPQDIILRSALQRVFHLSASKAVDIKDYV